MGISRPGVKMRIRMSVSGRSAGRMNVDSEKFISFVMACIVSAGEAARIEEDGQLIAAELLRGEDIEVQVAVSAAHDRVGPPGPRRPCYPIALVCALAAARSTAAWRVSAIR